MREVIDKPASVSTNLSLLTTLFLILLFAPLACETRIYGQRRLKDQPTRKKHSRRRFLCVTIYNITMISRRMPRKKSLSDLEEMIMSAVWEGATTAEDVRASLAAKHPMKDSTVRTVLRRLEEKGYLTHSVDGRTYLYRAVEPRRNVGV